MLLLYVSLILVVISVVAALTAAATTTVGALLVVHTTHTSIGGTFSADANNFVFACKVYMRLLSHLVCHVS